MGQKNNSTIKGLKTATTGGKVEGRSFTTQNATKDMNRKPSADAGPRQASRKGEGSVSDDAAGTKSRAGLPPETTAMKAPEATLPSEALDLASPVVPIPSCFDGPKNAIWGWEVDRDKKLGKMGS